MNENFCAHDMHIVICTYKHNITQQQKHTSSQNVCPQFNEDALFNTS